MELSPLDFLDWDLKELKNTHNALFLDQREQIKLQEIQEFRDAGSRMPANWTIHELEERVIFYM